MKTTLLIAFFISLTISSFASHNLGGEITYKQVQGNTYKITVTTYTKESSKLADKCSLKVKFGDGDSAVFNRVNGPLGTLCSGTIPTGEMIGDDVKKNVYEGIHAYPGPGTYMITMEDPNRNHGICNIPGASDQQSFFLKSVLVIGSFLQNNSPVFLNPPIDNGCVGQCFTHNPAAFDIDGDSLVYTVIPCYGNGVPIAGYTFPDGVTAESINHQTGTFEWCAPATTCIYNIAILVEQWKFIGGKPYFAGSVMRDMQITTEASDNKQPKINKLKETYVEALKDVHYEVIATDDDPDNLKLTAISGLFMVDPNLVFTPASGLSAVKGDFDWQAGCSFYVQRMPHDVVFKVEDNRSPKKLTNYEVLRIRIIAPAVENVTASPFLKTVSLSWDEEKCISKTDFNMLVSYDVYRKNGCDNWTHQPGETGIPASAGYELIGSVDNSTNTFFDDNNGVGLTPGLNYTYIIVCRYNDGAQSYASEGKCVLVTGIKELARTADVKIVPNPSDGTFRIESEFYSHSPLTLFIRNALGQVIYQENTMLPPGGATVSLNLQPGIYLLELENQNGRSVKKISITKKRND